MRQGAMDSRVFTLATLIPRHVRGCEVVHFSSVVLLAVKLNAPVQVEANERTSFLVGSFA
jgi:hypothetical protein